MNTLALLPNLAGPDMLIIFLIVLIMFGAKKLPELARGLGQAVKEFSKAKEDVNNEFNRAAYASHSEEPQLPFQASPGSQPASHASAQHSYGSGVSTNAPNAPTGGPASSVPASSGSAADSASTDAHAAPVSAAASSMGSPQKSSV